MTSTRPEGKAVGAPVGPDSILWSIAGDPRGMITGAAAGIMQLMLPGLGAAITDHSDFFDDPYDRIFRSIPYIWRSIFSDGDTAGRQIRDFHTDIKGTDDKGRSYHALNPDIYWWAHATFTWEFFRAQELFFPGRLSWRDKEQLYAETVTWYRRYGVSDRPVPPTLGEFWEKFDHMVDNELELTPAVSWVLEPATNPGPSGRTRLPGPLGLLNRAVDSHNADLMRVVVYGSMPDRLRRRFDFAWTDLDRVRFTAVCAALQASGPAVRFGALDILWPEGTPHLDPRDRRKVVVSGPNPSQRQRRSRAAPAH